MGRKEYQVARGFFRINAACPNEELDEDFGDEGLVETNVVPNYEMSRDVLIVVRPGISCPDAVDTIKAIVVGLIEEGYLFGCDGLHPG